MRSKRSRRLSLPRFTKTNLQQVIAAKSLRRASNSQYEYQNLEPRQMLNADIGLNFTTTNDGSLFTSNSLQPNISAAVGENHIVQLTSRGFSVYDKANGDVLDQGTIGDFFGNVSTFATDVEPRVVYDSSFDRWYAVVVDNQDLNDAQPGSQGNRLIFAASNSANPLDTWKFAAVRLEGGFDTNADFVPDLWLSQSFRPTLSVDEFALTVTVQEAGSVEIANNMLFVGTSGTAITTLPKVALFGGAIEDGGPDPFGAGLNGGTNNRFESVRGLSDAFGFEPQFAIDTTLDSQTFPLGPADNLFALAIDGEGDFDTFPVGRQGDELILSEFSRDGTPNVSVGLGLENINRIPVPFYRTPDVVRQPTDVIRDRDSSQFNASVVQEGDFIFAAHSVRDVIVDPITGIESEGPNAVIRWYKLDTTPEIDPQTGEPIFLVDSGIIDGELIQGDDSIDLIDPSIDVGPNGTVAIGYTATGLNLFPSSYASIGVPIGGVDSDLAFNDPTLLKAGEATFVDTGNNFFGRYTTTVNDPFDPNNFWTFQQYAHDSTPTLNWAIQGTQFGPLDTNPNLDIPPINEDQDIHINLVGDNLEVRIGDQFNGDLVGLYDADGIGVLTIDGTGGADRFFVNIDDIDAAALSGSWVLVGDDDDQLFVNSTIDTTWQFDGDNGVNINNGRIIASGFVQFTAGTGIDRFELPTANYDIQHDVFGNDGNDVFFVDQNVTGQLFLDGQSGDDFYNIPVTSLPPGLTIDDTAGTNDQLTTAGTEAVDSIVVSSTALTINGISVDFDIARTQWGIDSFAVDARGDDDVFDISSTTLDVSLFGQRGSDTFNVVETASLTGAAELVIDGGEDANSLNIFQNDALAASTVVVTEDLISNMTSAPVRFSATGGSFSDSATSTGITLFGSDTRADVFEVFSVLAGDDLHVSGRAGDDRFIFENLVDGTAELIGGTGDDLFETNSVSIIDVTIDGSGEDAVDRIDVALTSADDSVFVNENEFIINGVPYPSNGASFTDIEDFAFFGLDGNDTFDIDRTTTVASFHGGGGNDTFNVTDATVTTGDNLLEIDGGSGVNTLNVVRNEFSGSQVVVNDSTIEGMTIATIDYTSIDLIDLTGSDAADDFLVETLLPTTLLVINAEAGNDSMLVRRTVLGNVDLNGGTGDDTHRIEVQGDKTRLVRVIDPNTIAGVDRTEVVFTTGADVITVDGRSVGLGSDRVDVDPGVEVLALEGLGGDDRFDVISTSNPRLELFGQAGDDTYNILDLNALSSNIAIFDSVNAENDTLLIRGTVNLDEFIIDENLITINGLVVSNATGDNIIGVEGFTLDGLEADDIFRINSTTRGLTYLGSEGNDQFFITDTTATTGTRDLVIDGGEGSNEIFVSRPAILGGSVAGTEIQIEDNRIVGMTAADIAYTATDGIFSLIELNGTTDAAGGDVFDDIFRVNTLADSTLLRVNALGGDDVVQVRAPAEGDVQIDGGAGSDNFLVALGGNVDRVVTVDDSGVNEGVDRLDVFFSNADETIEVNNVTTRITYAVGNSEVDFDETFEVLALHALGGDDRFVVNGTTTDQLILAGGDGDDTYELSNVFGSTVVTVIDSVNAENDRLTVDGTNGDDVFEINENSFLINGVPFISDSVTNSNIIGIESLEVNALDGDDTFIVNSATRGFDLNGGAGDDRFLIHDTAPDSGAANLVIDGGTGANTMDIQRIAGTPEFAVINENFIRNVANSTILYSATGGSFTGGNGGITINGLDEVNDSFLVFGLLEENSLALFGNGGNDYHRIEANVAGDVFMDGSIGRDRYVAFLDEDRSRNLRVADSGSDAALDRINVFLTQNSDTIVLDGPEVALFNDRLNFNPTIETVEILAGDGDDRIDVRQFDGVQFLSVKGQAGNDRFEVNQANLVENVRLIGDVGNDTFDLVSATREGFLIANGNSGEDFIRVGEDFLRNANLNGEEGDDRYDISFADRGQRNIVLADTGSSSNDSAIIRATDFTNQLTLRASGINSPSQLIGTTRQLESLELIGTDGRDITTMFAAPVANISIDTLTGSDIFNLNSNNGAENLVIDLGAEPDIANIRATAAGSNTTLNLGRDEDLVNIGSSLSEDSGNLDRLLGTLDIDLGLGADRLFVNDAQSAGGPGYILSDSSVSNDASVANRGFTGLTHTGAEFLQFRGNAQFNRFTVTPSDDVRFILDGNSPQNNALTVTGGADGRQLFSTGDFSGIWTFDTLLDVQFEQFSV